MTAGRRARASAGLTAWLAALVLVAAASGLGCTHRKGLVLWHSYRAQERATLEALTAEWNARHPDTPLSLLAVPNEVFADKITAAVPRGHGPDLMIFAHDRLGDWVESGIVEPIEFFVDEAALDHFIRPVLDALVYKGSLYGLPLSYKSTALFYNRTLVPTPPATTDELLTIGRRLTDRAQGRFGLVYQVNRLYFHAAWLHGFGGHVFTADGKLDLVNDGAIKSLDFARELAGPNGIVPAEVEGHLVAALFNDGRAAMAITGQWFLGEIKKGVDYAVAPLPTVSATGLPAAPFLGVEGVMMSRYSRQKARAFEVMQFLASDRVAVRRATEAHQSVANVAAYRDRRVAGDKVLMAFRQQAERARPMPATPAMRMVWTPYDNAMQAIIFRNQGAQAGLLGAEQEITRYLRGAGQ
jgi:arabinogalactan oligomer/maltooligosaccharide transport system substrate-binding protein